MKANASIRSLGFILNPLSRLFKVLQRIIKSLDNRIKMTYKRRILVLTTLRPLKWFNLRTFDYSNLILELLIVYIFISIYTKLSKSKTSNLERY